MLRGAQRHMIVVRTRDSKMFEEAYFVMRRDIRREGDSRPDMLHEANRILENNLRHGSREHRRFPRGVLWGAIGFFGGLLLGSGGMGLLWLLL